MENITDALYMAASILVLTIALAVSISSFTTTREQVDSIVQRETKIDLAQDNSGDYLNYKQSSDYEEVREVGIETVLSSIYRIPKENYVIYIKAPGSYTNLNMITTNLNSIYESYSRTGSEQKYGLQTLSPTLISTRETILYIDIDVFNNTDIGTICENIYKNMNNMKFKEYTGTYQVETGDGVDSSNKTTFRIITYIKYTS